jgi:hypothetical protein
LNEAIIDRKGATIETENSATSGGQLPTVRVFHGRTLLALTTSFRSGSNSFGYEGKSGHVEIAQEIQPLTPCGHPNVLPDYAKEDLRVFECLREFNIEALTHP